MFSVMDNSSSSDLMAEGGPRRLRAGAILQGRYRITRELGAGGMGAVYEAVDQRLEATVALKETLSTDDRLRRQFEQEARLLAQLHHPCLPRVSDYFSESGRAFLVMQFISDRTWLKSSRSSRRHSRATRSSRGPISCWMR